jgi:hypothetical protein
MQTVVGQLRAGANGMYLRSLPGHVFLHGDEPAQSEWGGAAAVPGWEEGGRERTHVRFTSDDEGEGQVSDDTDAWVQGMSHNLGPDYHTGSQGVP